MSINKSEESFTSEADELSSKVKLDIAIRALADTPSEIDLLGFSDYAQALLDFMKNERTQKPLTIAIDAPWGMGKTTLMGIMRNQLIKERFLTVWFDAWKYEKEDTLWSALILEILEQIRTQISFWQQIKIWTVLNWKRLDKEILLNSIFKFLVYILGFILLGVIVFLITSLWPETALKLNIKNYIKTASGLGFITGLYAIWKEIKKRLVEPFKLNVSKYIDKPNYTNKVGFLSHFQKDFKRLIDSVTQNGEYPLVIFIDDLDRCEPSNCVEIIEAINTLIDARHCIFVIGMDSQMVASSIQTKYKNFLRYFNDATDPGGLTLGQSFLEKIIQIHFRIPRANPEIVESFINTHLNAWKDDLPIKTINNISLVVKSQQFFQKNIKKFQILLSKLIAGEINITNIRKVILYIRNHGISVETIKTLFNKLVQKDIKLEVQANGKILKIKASSTEEMNAAVEAARRFVYEPEEKQKDVQEITNIIKALMRLGKSLDEAIQAVRNATPQISEEVLVEARQEVFATTFDDSEDVRQAIREAAKYLGYNPRKIKRFINAFRLQSLIANRRRLLESRVIELNILAKWVVITTRYPDVVEAMINDPNFIKSLKQVYDIKNNLMSIQDEIFYFVNQDPENQLSESHKDKLYSEEENLKSAFNSFLKDPRIKRLIEARDLINLLKDITNSETDELMYYLYLAQITIDPPK